MKKIETVVKEYINRKSQEVQEYTLQERITHLNEFFDWFKINRELEDLSFNDLKTIKLNDIQLFVDYLHQEYGHSVTTIKKRKTNISNVFKYFLCYGHIDENLFNSQVMYPAEKKKKEVYYDPKDALAILNSAYTITRGTVLQNRAILALFVLQGLRKFEASEFETSWYTDFKEQGLMKVIGKGKHDGKEEIIPLLLEAEEIIDEYLNSDEFKGNNKYMFESRYYGKDHLSVGYMDSLFKDAKKIVGCEHFTPHKLRKSITEYLIDEKGATMEEVQKMLRHDEFATTKKHYLQNRDVKISMGFSKKLRGEK